MREVERADAPRPCSSWPPTERELYERFAEVEEANRKVFPIVTDPWPPTEKDLPSDYGSFMPSERHFFQIVLLVESLRRYWRHRQRGFVAGDLTVYYGLQHEPKNYNNLTPDVMVVVNGENRERDSYVIWQEGMGPDVVIELLSPSTAREDRGRKKQIYQDRMRVPEYFLFDPFTTELVGFRLQGGIYVPIIPEADGSLVSEQTGLRLASRETGYNDLPAPYLRWVTSDGDVLPTSEEVADEEQQRADEARRRAEAEVAARLALERRVAELEARLRERGENGR